MDGTEGALWERYATISRIAVLEREEREVREVRFHIVQARRWFPRF